MRLLVVNPNTSEGVTRRIAEAAEAVAQPADRFVTRSAAFGPSLIVTPGDARRAVEGVLATVAAHGDGAQGIVLASFGDTGAAEVRAARPGVPVIGIAAAAFAAARALGGPCAIVSFGESLVPSLRATAERHGMAGALERIDVVPGGDLGDPGAVQERCREALTALCIAAAGRGVSSVVLGGGPLAGLARRIGPRCPVPVIDGTQAAIGLLRSLAYRNPAPAHSLPHSG